MAVPRSRSGNQPATALLPAGVPVATGAPSSRNTASSAAKLPAKGTVMARTPPATAP